VFVRKGYLEFSTGLSSLDGILKGIRPGDNVVWQVDSVEDYIPFVHHFCRQSQQDQQDLIYFRFAEHESLLPPDVSAEVFQLHPEQGFEVLLDEIFKVIERFGIGACYVFDCLSDLTVDWYSDRMLGNFFRLTCPYLYDFETATYFALLKDRHTAHAVNMIHTTAQVVIDVYRHKKMLYVHPQKVDKRHSDTMYMLHQWKDDDFLPVRLSATVSEILSSAPQPWLDFTAHRFDVWTQTFSEAQKSLKALRSCEACAADDKSLFKRMLRMAISRDERVLALAETYFEMEDLIKIGKRMIGTGLIGGKSVGMLLARAILLKKDPKWQERLGAHDSFYVGSDVFYTYLIRNGCWWTRRRMNNPETLQSSSHEVRQRLLAGTFPEDIMDQFMEMLNYFGQSPIIVRSSSLLEDAYGNAFSGKYDSYFLANQGTPQERLEEFIIAVRRVYASTMSEAALSYRQHWGLMDRDEQMAILVQRVCGAPYDRLFFPQVAGVGFSFNPFVWSKEIDAQAGVVRLVFGLGTRAVDRCDDDYTRVISLSAPERRPEASADEKQRYTQRHIDLLDLRANQLLSSEFDEAMRQAGDDLPMEMFASYNAELARMAKERNMTSVFPWTLTFEGLLSSTSFVEDLHSMLATLEEAYEHPVDIEFSANFVEDKSLKIDVLQCRPFQVRRPKSSVLQTARVDEDKMFLRTEGPIIGNSLSTKIDRILYVVPSEYSQMGMSDRYSVARLIGSLTHLTGDHKADTIMLVGPGRWGTTTPSLGVPVSFAEIDTVSIVCELALMHEGLVPDVSLGTHFFNDLVEMDMLYLAIYPSHKGSLYQAEFFEQAPNRLTELLPNAASWAKAVRVIDSDWNDTPDLGLYMDTLKQEGFCYFGAANVD
jgi:pyruvate, water dikinase